MTRYARDDALSERQFELLLRGARQLDEPRDFEAELALWCAGRLGMRGGEIAHLRTDWINWPDRTVEIPLHDPCDHGKDSGICGYCRRRARDYHEDNADLSMQEALDRVWKPKTENAARSIPFDIDVRIELTLAEFSEDYDRFPRSKATLNRRIDAAAEASDVDARIYPHALRASAATMHAARDVSPYALMSVMGWNNLQTARSYVRASDEAAAVEIRSKNN